MEFIKFPLAREDMINLKPVYSTDVYRFVTRVTNRPGNSGIVPEIKASSRTPESTPNVPEIVYFF
jgi:hypothetical protein